MLTRQNIPVAALLPVVVAALVIAGYARRAPVPPAQPAQSVGNVSTPAVTIASTIPALQTARYVVPTITCPGCAERIKASARKLPGVYGVAIDGRRVSVGYDSSKTNPDAIAEAIRAGGDTVLPGT